jgi:hypothetical protein
MSYIGGTDPRGGGCPPLSRGRVPTAPKDFTPRRSGMRGQGSWQFQSSARLAQRIGLAVRPRKRKPRARLPPLSATIGRNSRVNRFTTSKEDDSRADLLRGSRTAGEGRAETAGADRTGNGRAMLLNGTYTRAWGELMANPGGSEGRRFWS